MTDYEEKQERKDKVKNAALAAATALGGVAWTIAQNVLINRGQRAVEDWMDRDKKKQSRAADSAAPNVRSGNQDDL